MIPLYESSVTFNSFKSVCLFVTKAPYHLVHCFHEWDKKNANKHSKNYTCNALWPSHLVYISYVDKFNNIHWSNNQSVWVQIPLMTIFIPFFFLFRSITIAITITIVRYYDNNYCLCLYVCMYVCMYACTYHICMYV